MLFSLLKHYLELYITDTVPIASRSLYCFITSISQGVENYFPRLWGTSISDAIFLVTLGFTHKLKYSELIDSLIDWLTLVCIWEEFSRKGPPYPLYPPAPPYPSALQVCLPIASLLMDGISSNLAHIFSSPGKIF